MFAYNKPYLTFEQQLALLKGRGLIVTDDAAALSCLHRIGYYRLSAYWYPLRRFELQKCAETGELLVRRLDEFQPDSSFEQVLSLYVFGKRLRLLVLDAVERIEVALRVDVSYLLGSKDPFAHVNPELLHGNFAKRAAPATGRTRHQVWLDRYQSMVSRSQEDFVRHYQQKYGEPFPIWVAVELWEFGMLPTRGQVRIVSPNSTWPSRLRAHLEDFPVASTLSPADMGFPPNWRDQPLWRI